MRWVVDLNSVYVYSFSPHENRELMPSGKLSKEAKEAWQATLYSSTTMESLSYALFVCNALYLVRTSMYALLALTLTNVSF
jgi:hypothetical protein